MEYLPYGEVWFEEKAPNINENHAPKYNSQEMDKESGLYFFNARHYDPEIARFVTADTVIDGEDDVKGYNRFMYVAGNPIILKDPTGNAACGGVCAAAVVGYFLFEGAQRIGEKGETNEEYYNRVMVDLATKRFGKGSSITKSFGSKYGKGKNIDLKPSKSSRRMANKRARKSRQINRTYKKKNKNGRKEKNLKKKRRQKDNLKAEQKSKALQEKMLKDKQNRERVDNTTDALSGTIDGTPPSSWGAVGQAAAEIIKYVSNFF